MKSFKQFIDEKRRNPDQNPKIGILEALDKYKTDPNVYISFVEDVGHTSHNKLTQNVSGTKIGINPKSTYNTPNGIYAYPLKEAYKLYATETSKVLKVPFASSRPFVYIFKSKNPSKVLDLDKYNSKQYDKDYKKLAKIIIEYAGKKYKSKAYGWEIAKSLLQDATDNAKHHSIGGTFWNMTRMTFRFIIGDVFYNGVQGEKLNQMLKTKDNKVDFSNETINIKLDDFSQNDTPSSIQWNKIFRDLGYDGVADKQGNGIIHPAEPMQAVFFHKKAIEVLDMVMNKSYEIRDGDTQPWKGGTWDGGVWKKGTWEGGIWVKGTWLDGTWKKGTWLNGDWYGGIWEKGDWEKGIWNKGTWRDGTWENGTWYDGIWKDGTWEKGTWLDGLWESGTWEKGTWKGGIWFNGTWKDGVWGKGDWYDGTWKKGTWLDGKWKNGTWMGGTWLGGTWITGKIFNKKTGISEESNVSPPKFYKQKGIT